MKIRVLIDKGIEGGAIRNGDIMDAAVSPDKTMAIVFYPIATGGNHCYLGKAEFEILEGQHNAD